MHLSNMAWKIVLKEGVESHKKEKYRLRSLKILSIITVRGGCHPHKMLASLRNSSRKGGLGLPSQRSA
ncbi:hypothetical protein BDE02_02G208700 [Populus trichocarpa]|nr:hypothetical protein BDE02_02G208700 [Populus trichocarpa]